MVRTIKKPDVRKAEIVSIARQLFQTHDYERVTIKMILDQLGIAKGTIYHYFESKEALFDAVIESIVDDAIEKMEVLLETATGSALEKMKLLIKAGNMGADNQKLLEHLHRPSNDSLHAQILAAIIARMAPMYEQVINQGVKEGVFHTAHPLESAEFMLAAVQFLTDIGIYPWNGDDIKRRVAAFPTLIENLLQAQKGSFDFLIACFENR